jgi:cold shock CspA family protein
MNDTTAPVAAPIPAVAAAPVPAPPKPPIRRTGIVRRFLAHRHFGWLRFTDSPGEIFFHALSFKNLDPDILLGQLVEFEVRLYNGKLSAQDIVVIAQPGTFGVGGPR